MNINEIFESVSLFENMYLDMAGDALVRKDSALRNGWFTFRNTWKDALKGEMAGLCYLSLTEIDTELQESDIPAEVHETIRDILTEKPGEYSEDKVNALWNIFEDIAL